jgi:hypothetical protein
MPLLLASLFLSASLGGVAAFEYRGLRSGMTEAEALAVGVSSGLDLSPVANMKDAYWIGGVNATGIVQFCDGKIYSVSENIQGGLDAFASLAEDNIREYGQPNVQSRSGYDASGVTSYIMLDWRIDATETVSVALTSLNNVATTAVLYSTWGGCQ